jgi:beta,beta-carotene 9',10'-dioxygenase
VDRYVGEPIFVPNPHGQSEDDGVLLVVTREEDKSSLIVLDAQSMAQVAEIVAPFTLMSEFHGRYFSPL